MATYSRKGWFIRTALRVGRSYCEVKQSETGEQVLVAQTELTMRAIIEARMNWIGWEVAPAEDCPQPGEVRWVFRQKNNCGYFVGSHLTFLAPAGYDIPSIRAKQTENNKKARIAAKERSEIRRAMAPVRKSQSQPAPAAPSKRRL